MIVPVMSLVHGQGRPREGRPREGPPAGPQGRRALGSISVTTANLDGKVGEEKLGRQWGASGGT